MSEEIDLVIKPSKGDNVDVRFAPAKTVADFKKAVAEKCGIPAEEQRLIFKGQLLKDDNTLESYGPSNGVVIHMVRGRSVQSQAPAPEATPTPTTEPARQEAPAAANQPNPFAAFAQVFAAQFVCCAVKLENTAGLVAAAHIGHFSVSCWSGSQSPRSHSPSSNQAPNPSGFGFGLLV